MACADYIEPLNLECIFVNIFAGSTDIFVMMAMILIALGAGYFRMRGIIAVSMFALFTVIMSLYVGAQIYLLVLFFISIGVFWAISNIIKK